MHSSNSQVQQALLVSSHDGNQNMKEAHYAKMFLTSAEILNWKEREREGAIEKEERKKQKEKGDSSSFWGAERMGGNKEIKENENGEN